MKKLELTWVGKGETPAIEPRILIHDSARDYGDATTENMLIHGDNLLALKALEQKFAGKIKCVYIDPPFNTGARIDADGNEVGYEDGVEHSIWLQLMAERIKIIHSLLRNDGALFIHLDDNEVDYCRVMTDEIFGRKNFMNRITVDSRSPSAFSTVNPGVFKAAEYILFYAKCRESLVENPIRVERPPDYAYDKFITNIEDNYRNWKYVTVADAFQKAQEEKKQQRPQTVITNYHKFIVENAHRIFRLTAISDTGAGKETVALKHESIAKRDVFFKLQRAARDDIFILNGQQMSFYSKNVTFIDGKKCASKMLTDIWEDIAWEGIANEGNVRFKKGKKPERLIKRCLELSTSIGDLVLDSFLGSGTTAAVAHKMGRRWIGIEFGEHCYSHCVPRLKEVVDGDQGGISKAVGWQCGGGFKFYELAPTLIIKDAHGRPIMDTSKYNPEKLAMAVAKLHGFEYAPDPAVFWKQGRGHDNSFIYVTTQYVTAELLGEISRELKIDERLLVCAAAFDAATASIVGERGNVIIKKIPQSILGKCEFGADNYNLAIVEIPDITEEIEKIEEENENGK
jgi:adenine-specific DNA-methyltransferase